MNKKPVPVKNIIFDLGGVIVDLDLDKWIAAFAALGIEDAKTRLDTDEGKRFFERYETGKVETAGLIAYLRAFSVKAPADEEIINALNSVIIGFPADRIALLNSLKGKYRLFLFSNNTAVHHARVHALYRMQHGGNLDDHFEKAYYSHLIGRRKPDPAAFMYVIKDAGINPKETLFIDDLPENLRGASLARLQTAHIAPGTSLLDLGLDKI